MKPVVLCMMDDLSKIDYKKYQKANLKSLNLAEIGVGKLVETKEEYIEKEIKSGFNNEALTNMINYAKKSKAKVHIIGSIKENKNILDVFSTILEANGLKTYLHLYADKDEVKSYKNISEIFSSKVLDIDIPKILFKGKKCAGVTAYNAKRVSSKDLVVFFNTRLSGFDETISALKLNKNKILTLFPSKGTNMYEWNCKTLGEYISDASLKQLRVGVDNYTFDGYQDVLYKGEEIVDKLPENIDKYDFIFADGNKLELDKFDNFNILIIGKLDGKDVILSNNYINRGNSINILATVLELLGLKAPKMVAGSLNGHAVILGIVFEIVSVLFIISCIVFYMARLLHFYLIK